MLDSLIPADPSLFHEGHDPNDRKLGEVVARGKEPPDEARVVLLGCPQDVGIVRNAGRPGAAAAPREIRRRLYRLSAPAWVRSGSIFDAGDVPIADTLEETHERHAAIVTSLLRNGRTAIVLGGGNDVSYPDVLALAGRVPDFLAFNIDRHFDVRESPERHSGTPYRQLIEGGILPPANFWEMGHTPGANGPAYHRYLADKGVAVHSYDDLQRRGIEATFGAILRERPRPAAIFWGFDMDAVRSSDAPGVSAGYPMGFTAAEICRIAAVAGKEPRTRLFEISECNPELDIDGRTAKLAAMMIVSFLESGGGAAAVRERT